MKRVVKASLRTDRDRMAKMVKALSYLGVSEHTMLVKFLDYLEPNETIEILQDLAFECELDDELEEYLNN